MPSRYIELKDNIVVEIGSPGEPRTEMSGSPLDRVDTKIEEVGKIIEKVARTIGDSFEGLHDALDIPIAVEKAEVEIGLSFSAEGTVFITKAKTEGSLSIKISFKPVGSKSQPKAEGPA